MTKEKTNFQKSIAPFLFCSFALFFFSMVHNPLGFIIRCYEILVVEITYAS